MFYKIKPGSQTFKKLHELRKELNRVHKEASEAVKKFGAEQFSVKAFVLGGGLSAVYFGSAVPQGWAKSGAGYRPKRTNKEGLSTWENLPVVEYDALNKIVGFKGWQELPNPEGRGNKIIFSPQVHWTKDDKAIILRIREGCEFKPNADMTEILGSEFERLLKK